MKSSRCFDLVSAGDEETLEERNTKGSSKGKTHSQHNSKSFPYRGSGSTLAFFLLILRLSFQSNVRLSSLTNICSCVDTTGTMVWICKQPWNSNRESVCFPCRNGLCGLQRGGLFGKVCSSDSDAAGQQVATSKRISSSYLLFLPWYLRTGFRWNDAPGHTRPLAPSQTNAVSNSSRESLRWLIMFWHWLIALLSMNNDVVHVFGLCCKTQLL